MKLLLIAISVLLLAPNFIHVQIATTPAYDHIEKFDSSLGYINSVFKLTQVADSLATSRNVLPRSLEYATIVSTLIRSRFYHGFSQYRVAENWIAAVGESIFGYGLASIVKPDEILQYAYGGCSQQTIILMEVMKNKMVPYRSVGFLHHYASELFLQGNWYFFDPDMEPAISDSQRLDKKWNGCADSLKSYYDRSHYKDLDWKFGRGQKVLLGQVNSRTAPNARLFQSITNYLSKSLWILPLMVVLKIKRRQNPGNLNKLGFVK